MSDDVRPRPDPGERFRLFVVNARHFLDHAALAAPPYPGGPRSPYTLSRETSGVLARNMAQAADAVHELGQVVPFDAKRWGNDPRLRFFLPGFVAFYGIFADYLARWRKAAGTFAHAAGAPFGGGYVLPLTFAEWAEMDRAVTSLERVATEGGTLDPTPGTVVMLGNGEVVPYVEPPTPIVIDLARYVVAVDGVEYEVGEAGAYFMHAIYEAWPRSISGREMEARYPALEGKNISRDVKDKLPVPVRRLVDRLSGYLFVPPGL